MTTTAIYSGPSEIADVHEVTRQAVYGWMAKAGWPIPKGHPLDRAVIDKYVAGFIVPHRKGNAKNIRQPGPPAVPPAPEPPQPTAFPRLASLAPPAPVTPAAPIDVKTATLEELEVLIRQATNSDQAETLSKQVRALKVVREIQDRDGTRIDAGRARAEIASAYHFFQTAIMGIGRAVAGSLEGLTAAEIEAVLDGRHAEALGELKRGLNRAIDADTEPGPVGGDAGRTDGSRAADPERVGGAVSGAEQEAEQQAGPVE